MKRKSIQGLILLMSLSLLGIIAAQYLWIQQSVNVQREKFQAAVYRSLDNAVQRMEKEQSADYIFREFFHQPRSKSSTSYRQDNNGNVSIIRQKSTSSVKPNIVYQKKDTVITQGGTRIEVHTEVNGNQTDHQVWINASGEAVDLIELEEQMVHIEDSIEVVISAMEERNQEIKEVFNQMKREIEARHNPLQARIDLEHLNEVLTQELAQNGIDTKFEFGVFNQITRQLSNYKTTNFDISKANTYQPFQINLFPRDIFRGITPYELVVYFPDAASYLVKTIGWMVSLSAIFTLFILITFFITMRTILTQKKVSQIKTDFINNMTHEFKTPIATISLATDSILTPTIINNEAHVKSFLKIIKEENSRMNSHVERVLQMSQIEKKDFSVVKASHDIHELILRAVDNMQLLANETNGKISTSLKAELSVFLVDEIHFTNVIVNLLENALKYAKEQPLVTLSTINNNNGIVIKIADNGIGMTREQQNKIFEKFYRAAGGNVHNVKGFGLGLSYVKAVIDAHHGSISVKSKINVGTEFSIQLPYK
ncbi:HAMP domain-containing histidine kinase [Carboxylicivirga mesophila]|uniref:histidine kinase n=1 Tax=Carboxylicivirga mesophila TaxID=1166478 RepID=A0ABS5KD18_9BACT|nr:HAMP domain-containing sensor histidine kinase [Carboxylicivirga mesophila]MBS2212393.1 HAMP domain-containing histidine kinase [Carboxylicivirga mesophila]